MPPTLDSGSAQGTWLGMPDWHTYRAGGEDNAGRKIDKIYALGDDYIIYLSDGELFYEITPALTRTLAGALGKAGTLIAWINRLFPVKPSDKESEAYRNRLATLETIAASCEMVFSGQSPDALDILGRIPIWRFYRAHGVDRAGRKIEKVYALDDDYIVYFSDCELFYETTPELAARLGTTLGGTNAALARIKRLLPDNPEDKSPVYLSKFSTLELAADGCEMVFCGQSTNGLDVLNSIRDKLQTTEEVKRRLAYQAGTVSITLAVWLLYLWLQWMNYLYGRWEPWMLSAALAMAGGVFSVCLNLESLQVNVNQRLYFLWIAGATRAVIAFLAGIGLLLAMRSKMFAGIAYAGKPPSGYAPLEIAEMFFCFLAGFSEFFVPNILSDAEKKPSDSAKPATPATPAASPPPATPPVTPPPPVNTTN